MIYTDTEAGKMNNEKRKIMKTTQWMCKPCSWVGIVVEDEENAGNEWSCFRCGNTDRSKFRPALASDVPLGCTLQQINFVRPSDKQEPS